MLVFVSLLCSVQLQQAKGGLAYVSIRIGGTCHASRGWCEDGKD